MGDFNQLIDFIDKNCSPVDESTIKARVQAGVLAIKNFKNNML
ncbi:MAG: hypothetical protein AABZ67_09775 [Pseudomonadota bacterium]